MGVAKYYQVGIPDGAGFRFMTADWWTQLTPDEYKKESAERRRCLEYMNKHGKMPKDAKYREMTMSGFYVSGVVPTLTYMLGKKSVYADMSSMSLKLTNGKCLHIFSNFCFFVKFHNTLEIVDFFYGLMNSLYNGTHGKFKELMPGVSLPDNLSAIARKSQVVFEWWWNRKGRMIFMPDGTLALSQSATDKDYGASPSLEDVVKEHYESMMLNFQLKGVTESTDPITL